ncbi:MAG: DoxX family protein, partial [Ignavibacteria bacterium]
IMPFVLIIFGALYIMGFFTPATSLVLALTSLAKVLTRGLFPTEGIPFNKDLLFFACFLLTLFAGAGVISFDALLDKKKKTAVISPQKTNAVTAEVVSQAPETGTAKENPPAS